MKTNGRVLILVIAAVTAITANAQIYRWTDASGKLHYSDTPPDGVKHEQVNRDDLPLVHRQRPAYRSNIYSTYSEAEGGQYVAVDRSKASLFECKNAKRSAIRAERARDHLTAEHYDSWIWKNCKGYSSELRQLAREAD